MQTYQSGRDLQLLEKEQALSAHEKEAKEYNKKKELEFVAKQAREDYMKKMNSISGPSSGGAHITIKDPKAVKGFDKRGSGSTPNGARTTPSGIGLSNKLSS